MSLAELLVTMFLTGIVGVVVVSFFVSFTTAFSQDQAATRSSTTAALGMNDLTRVVRAGTEIPVNGAVLNNAVFEVARDEEMVINAFIDTDSASPEPVRIRFWINGERELMETRYLARDLGAGYWGFDATAAGTRVIARQLPVRQPGEPWLFTYINAEGAELAIPARGDFTATERRSIAAVRITLTVQADITSRADPVTLRTTVGIPNLGVARVGL